MGFFKSVGRFFKTIATDILPPAILGIAGGPAGPYLAAAYSGIKTGIETGSPFAGIGSAAMSFGLSQIGQGLRGQGPAALTDAASPIGGRSVVEGTNAASLRASMGAGQSAILGPSGTAITTPGALGAGRVGSLIPGTAGVSSLPLGTPEIEQRPAQPTRGSQPTRSRP